jgi:preprotein translocase subunit SecD
MASVKIFDLPERRQFKKDEELTPDDCLKAMHASVMTARELFADAELLFPRINTEVTGREAMIEGNFTKEEVGSIAKWFSDSQTGKHKFEPGKIKFEIRLASYQKAEGWKIGFVPGPPKTPVWISPEVALTNSDIARAWPEPDADEFSVGFLLTEEGSLKLARLTKSHIGENVAIMVDGQARSAPKIMAEIIGGRAVINGKFTEEEAGSLAKGIMMK